MKKLLPLLVSVILIGITACSKKGSDQATPGKTVTIVHATDTTQVPFKPKRIVTLTYGAMENLDLINANIVGTRKTYIPNYLSEYRANDSITDVGSLGQISMETINALNPDLIIGGWDRDLYDELSEIAPTIMPFLITSGQMNALEKNLNNLGNIFGKQATAAYDSALTALKAKAAKVRKKAKQHDYQALIILHNRGRFSAFGSGSRFGFIYDALGLEEAKKGLETELHGVRVSSEFIMEVNPDILFIVDRSAAIGDPPLDREELENELIQQTKAYKNDKIIYLSPQAWYISGGSGVHSLNVMIGEVAQVFE